MSNLDKKNKKDKKDLAGIIHCHCHDYSPDATESFDLMVATAKKSNLDFIIFTDHNSVGLKKDKKDKNYDGLQVIAGTEITPACNFARFEDKSIDEDESNGHLLVFDLDELPSEEFIDKGIRQEMIDFFVGKGLLCFLAHPDHKGTKAFGIPSYRCKNFDIDGYTGFSLWDIMTDWQNYTKGIASGLLAFFFPILMLKGPEKETIARWDALTKERSYSIIGEIDQHAYQYKLYGYKFTIFKCGFSFKTIRTHIVLNQAINTNADFKETVIQGLRQGHTYVSCDYLKDADGFTFTAECDSQKYIMGDTISNANGKVTFNINTPSIADIRIIKDGERVHSHYGDTLTFTVEESGVYRVEVYRKVFFKMRPWIFSNTIRIL